MAIKVFRLLSNGMGGIDWSGLPAMCAWLGISDVEGLLQRLDVIISHKPPDPD